MVYIRGHRADYEEWEAAGNPGWGWEDVLSAYKAMEDTEAGGNDFRGTGGPLFVSANRAGLHPLVKDYVAACESAGLPHNPDFNGAVQEGTGTYQMTIHKARRNSAARAFLRPAMKRPNCRVITGAMVTRVLIEDGRAVGVEYVQGGQTRTLRAKAEVILSGGAVNSPQLLQLSGIGPGALLQSLGIPVLRDNPNVGDHLSDHQGINYTWRMKVPTYNDELRPWWGKLLAGMKYVLAGAGPLSKSINHGGGFFRTSPDLDRPNMQLYMQAFSTLIPRDRRSQRRDRGNAGHQGRDQPGAAGGQADRPGQRDQCAKEGRHPLAALEAQPDREEMAKERREAASWAASSPRSQRAIRTAIPPLAASSTRVAAAAPLLPVRSTLVAPILPDPIWRRSPRPMARVMTMPKGIEPRR
jgi:choline dehydrogenase-like flavoprotein